MTRKQKKSSGAFAGFDKYAYYKRAVQGPEIDVVFIRRLYREIRGE